MRAWSGLVLLVLVLAACGTERPPDDVGDDPPDASGPVSHPDAGAACGPETCSGCCATDGTCADGTASAACGVGGTACTDCGSDTCAAGACVPVAPREGDGCDSPLVLVPGSDGRARASLDLRSFTDEVTSSCGPGGADGVLAFDVTDGAFVDLRITSPAGTGASLALRTDCGLRVAETTCVQDSARSGQVSWSGRLNRGRYYAWVELDGAATAPLEATLEVIPLQQGDSCNWLKTVALTNGAGTVHDTLAHYGPDGLACDGGRDAVYTFTLNSQANVTVTVTPEASFDPSLDLSTTCGASTPVCSGPGAGAVETITRNLAAGTHYVTVASTDGSVGTYDLAIRAVPVTVADGETCTSPNTLTFDATGHASAYVSVSRLADDFVLACSPYAGSTSGDAAYRFHVSATSDFHATVRNTLLSGSTLLALRSDCSGADLACGAAIDLADLAPGDYTLLTDSSPYEHSSVTLDATLTPPKAAGETCARTAPLALSNGAAGGTAHVTGSFTGVTDDLDGTVDPDCTSMRSAPDLFYALTIDRTLMVDATLTRSGTAGTVELGLVEPAYCATGYTEECPAGTSGKLHVLLGAGTHVLRVQGLGTSGFTLDVSAVSPPDGESCANPVAITLPGGGGTRSHAATTKGSTQENFNNACMGYDRPDRVYAVTLPDPASNLTITTTAVGSTNAPGFIVVKTCSEIVPDLQSCENTTKATRTLRATALAAGTYFVWVKGPTTTGTDYTIDFTSTPTPAGDSCAVAIPLTLSQGLAGGTAHVTGTTVGANDDYTACSQVSPAFPDTVYAVTIDRPLELRATMTPASGAGGAVTLRDAACKDQSGLCATSSTLGTAAVLKTGLAAGTWYLSIDHTSGGPGPFTLDVSLTAPQPGETCANPAPLSFPNGAAGGTTTLNVDLRNFSDAATDDCGQGADAYYTFTTDRALDLRVKPTTTTGSPRVALGTGCGAMSCDFLASSSLAVGSLAPGTHVLVVDADYPRSEQAYSFDVSLTPPTAGDTCANPIPLNIPSTGGSVTVTGSTKDAFSEFSDYTCTSYYADRIYTFTTTRTSSLVARVTTPTGAGSHVLALETGSCDPKGTPTACDPGKRDASYVRKADLAPGTYFLIVDRADYNTPEDYTLEVTLGDRPAGDTCASALPLGLPANGPGEVTVHGETGRFFQDVTPSCGASTGTRDAPDVVYAFTLNQPMNVRFFSHATTTGFRPTIALRKGCATTDTDQACGWTPTYSADTWTSDENLAAGTWYVVVDGYDRTQAGGFDLTVRTSPANPPGDSCGSPQTLALSQGTFGRATATATFADYFEDFSDCWNSSGADLVYAITTDRPRKLHALAAVSVQTAGPTLSLRKSPCAQSTSQVACERPSYDGTGRLVADLPQGTSYLLVKSPLAYPQGTVSLEVQVDDFAAGDTCTNALPLAFSNGAAGGTASASGDSYRFAADATLTCDSSKAPDAYYTFTTDRPLNLTASVSRQNTSEPFTIGLFPGCGGTQKACQNSGFSSQGPTLTQSALPAGTWVLVVRGGTTSPSGYTLNATLAP